MGMSAGSGDKKAVQSEINVTPLIDVLLVLLIIFLVVMPIMVKMETLEVPRKIEENQAPDPNAIMLVIKVRAPNDIVFIENEKEMQIQPEEMIKQLRPKLEQAAQRGADRVVFVDFGDLIPWGTVMGTMDSIRSLANDVNHDAIKVALKIKEEGKP